MTKMQELKEALEASTGKTATVSGDTVKVTMPWIETNTFQSLGALVKVRRAKITIKRSGTGLTIIISK